jgi:biotin carboxyl carrier protein
VTRYFVDVGEETFEVDLSAGDVRVNGESVEADLVRVDGTDVWSLLIEGRSHRVVADGSGSGGWNLRFGGESHSTRVVDERTRYIEEMTGGDEGPRGPAPVLAPMPGMVIRIEVAEGDIVRPGQGVAIVEAMKMENELKASAEGRVAHIHVSEGQAVEKDQLLIDLAALLEEEGEA